MFSSLDINEPVVDEPIHDDDNNQITHLPLTHRTIKALANIHKGNYAFTLNVICWVFPHYRIIIHMYFYA